MPHATNTSSTGLQALILCGPGASLSTFTAKPEDFPKAIIPIANRPMIWYALDYCYRMGINDISIVTPPASEKAISDSMKTNPYLTSLPTPKPDIIAPSGLTHESGTADVLRQPEVRKAIDGDFVVLPCDIVSELPGESLLEAWMIQQDDDGLGGGLNGRSSSSSPSSPSGSRKGGLGVWYPTKGEQAFKGEETDVVVTSPVARPPVVPPPKHSIRGRLEQVMYAMPSDTLNDIVDGQASQEKGLPLRPGILRRAGRVKMRTSYRDAHVYVLPRWVLDLVAATPEMDSLSEDVVGSWAKASWQPGFADKLGLKDIFENSSAAAASARKGGGGNDTAAAGAGASATSANDDDDRSPHRESSSSQEKEESETVDVMSMVSTRVTNLPRSEGKGSKSAVSSTKSPTPKLAVPPFLGYMHPLPPEGAAPGSFPLLRRVDTANMLLAVSLRLARLESVEEAGRGGPGAAAGAGASPLAHAAKVADPAGVAGKSTISRSDCLLDLNVRVEERCVVKESVVGANCVVRAGARLTRCLLMDGVVVGEKCQLTDCVVGRRAQIGRDSILRECRVQDGNAVAEGTEAKGEEIMVFEGLDEEANFDDDDDDDDGQGFNGVDMS